MKKQKTAGKTIGVKYPLEIDSRISAVAAELSRRAAGLPQPISNVMHVITAKGLDVIEHELGLSKPTKASKPPQAA